MRKAYYSFLSVEALRRTGAMFVMAATLFQAALMLNAVLFLSTSVQADTTGCAPANEVAAAIAKAQNIASQELGPAKAEDLLTKLKEKAVIIKGEVCFLTKDFADFGRIVAQFFDDYLSNTIRQKSDAKKPSFAQADGDDSGASSRCSCLNCPSGHESWCPPMVSKPRCCPHLCADIFTTISVGALTGLEGSGVDACCEESANECSSAAKSRKSSNSSTPPKGIGLHSSREPASSSDGPPDFNFGVSSATEPSSSEPSPDANVRPSSIVNSPSPSPETLTFPSPAATTSPASEKGVVSSVAGSAGLGELAASGSSQVIAASVTPGPFVVGVPSPMSSADYSPMPSIAMETASTASASPELLSNILPPTDDQEETHARSPGTQPAQNVSPTATPSVSRESVQALSPAHIFAENVENADAPGGVLHPLPSPIVTTTPYPVVGAQPAKTPKVESATPSSSGIGKSRARPFETAVSGSSAPALALQSPATSLDSFPTGASSDAPGPYIVGFEAEPPPPPLFTANPSPFGGPSQEWASQTIDGVDSSDGVLSPPTPSSSPTVVVSPTKIPSPPQPLYASVPSPYWTVEDESLVASPERMSL